MCCILALPGLPCVTYFPFLYSVVSYCVLLTGVFEWPLLCFLMDLNVLPCVAYVVMGFLVCVLMCLLAGLFECFLSVV